MAKGSQQNPADIAKTASKLGELKIRFMFLIGALIVFRAGTYIPVPGVDPVALAAFFEQQAGGLLGMVNLFSGGALSRFGIFAMGIMPYISSSIIMQMASHIVPSLQQLRMPEFAVSIKCLQDLRRGGAKDRANIAFKAVRDELNRVDLFATMSVMHRGGDFRAKPPKVTLADLENARTAINDFAKTNTDAKDKLRAKINGLAGGVLAPPRESRLAALLRIHRVVNDHFTMATTGLLTTDLDLLEELIMAEGPFGPGGRTVD